MKNNLLFLLKIGVGCLPLVPVLPTAGQNVAYASARAQTPRQHQQSLVDALKALEKRHGVVFDYNRRELRDKTVGTDAGRATTLEESLQRLLTPFHLAFEKNNAHSYLIYNRDRQRPVPSREIPAPLRPEASNGAAEPPTALTSPIAPDRELRGRVTDATTNEGLPGVSVVLKGTTRGTTTDATGAFRLSIPDRSADAGEVTLVFSYVGFESQELPVGGQTTFDVALKTNTSTLSEVVVIGYGERERKTSPGPCRWWVPTIWSRPKPSTPNWPCRGVCRACSFPRRGARPTPGPPCGFGGSTRWDLTTRSTSSTACPSPNTAAAPPSRATRPKPPTFAGQSTS